MKLSTVEEELVTGARRLRERRESMEYQERRRKEDEAKELASRAMPTPPPAKAKR